MKVFKQITILLFAILLSSCQAYKKVTYLKEAKDEVHESLSQIEAVIMPNDLLSITVNASTPEAALAFNLPIIANQSVSGSNVSGTPVLQSYLVDYDGSLTFPIIGKIDVKGKTRKEVEELIKNKIYPTYIKEEPIVIVRYQNFNISVLGEVNRPGNYNIKSERVTILDALALAGDMTLYGKRQNILLIRDEGMGKKTTVRINLQDAGTLNSPYFYLQQNDVVYVEPNKHKANSSSISSTETLSISITSTLISLTSLLVTILN